MNGIVLHIVRFILFALAQVLVLNNIEPGWGIYPMIYPLFILLLPFNMGTVPLMAISFVFGWTIDMMTNSFGLIASSSVLFAYFRPLFFKAFSPRDGQENIEIGNVYTLGFRWFVLVYGNLLLIQTSWYFIIESFKLNDLLIILRKIVLNVPISFLLSLLVQFIFISNKKTDR